MLNAQQVWHRLRQLPAFKGMAETDFRPLVYVQTFTPAAGATTANAPQDFPGGAIVLGVSASAYVPGVGAGGQSGRNRQLFGINFTYNNNEALTPGGPIVADALMGGGDADLFPARELVLAPNQRILCQVSNLTTGDLTVQVAYHCLVYRFGS